MDGVDDCEVSLRSREMFLSASSSGTCTAADAHNNQPYDHETKHDNKSNGPAREPVAHAVGSASSAPAVVPGVMATIGCALAVACAGAILGKCSISSVAENRPPRASQLKNIAAVAPGTRRVGRAVCHSC